VTRRLFNLPAAVFVACGAAMIWMELQVWRGDHESVTGRLVLLSPLAAFAAWFCTRTLLRKMGRRAANRFGRCLSCGYDLRATPHRCPECGRVPGGKLNVT
jgi:predicted RNA-binding Zn-ribbon protein involved in translation (DUF1610 family)